MNIINDLQSYYFYRKHHEHVPGIMLVEVARQAAYAQYYRTSTHQRGQITLTIKHIGCDFEGYVDASYPVAVCVETTTQEDEMRESGFERRTARFFQKGQLVATIKIVGMPIKMKIFKRLRSVKPDPAHWFVPVKAFARTAVFIDESGKKFEAGLRKVSPGGMEVVIERRLDLDTPLDFVLSVDGIGYVDGKVTVAELREEGPVEDAQVLAGRLVFTELSTDARRKWFEAIKNFAHVECLAGTH